MNENLAAPKSGNLQIRLLGSPQISIDNLPLTGLTSAKAQALLFYLAVTAREHTRTALAALLWGDLPETAARGNLRKALQQLRTQIGEYLSIERNTVALQAQADCWTDVVEFSEILQKSRVNEESDKIQRALDLYRGDFLEGFYVRNAPDFENWWLAERARLRELMLECLHTLADYRAEQGELEEAITLTRRYLALEPWREAAHRRLMTWLARSSQRGAALTQYEVCRQILADELQVEPAAETTALYTRIRDGDFKPPSSFKSRMLFIKQELPAFLDEDSQAIERPIEYFVGRESQLASLETFLEAALAGNGSVAFVSGEAGWGKTSLLSEFSRRAQEKFPDLIVASGVCTTLTGTGDPYLPFREVMQMLCGDVEQRWAAGTISHQQALRLWRFLPRMFKALLVYGRNLIATFVPGEELLIRMGAHDSVDPKMLEQAQDMIIRKPDQVKDTGLTQSQMFEEYAKVLQAVTTDQPLLLILDDLHWADESSVSLLYHLGRRLILNRILILGAYRPEDISLGREGEEHPLVSVLSEFKRLFGDMWVSLGQSDQDEGRSFVDALLDIEPNQLSEDFRQILTHYTKGHPLFTVEILQELQDRGDIFRDSEERWIESPTITWDTLPRRVEGVIEKRVNRLSPQLREALIAASVEGEEFTAEVVAQVRTVDEGEMVEMLSGELGKKHRLVRARGTRQLGGKRISRYQFRHNLFHMYLYSNLDSVERAYLHEAVGKNLEVLYQDQTGEIAVHLARHFQEAGILDKAVEYYKQAGDSAARVYAHTEAISHYSQAIHQANQLSLGGKTLTLLYTNLGRSLELNSQYDQALNTYEEMEKWAIQHNDLAMELASLVNRVAILSVPTAVHDPIRALELGERALQLADALEDQEAEAKILWSLSLANYLSKRVKQAIDYGERSLRLALQLSLREQTAQTLNDLGGFIYLYNGQLDQVKETLQEASSLWRQLGNMPMLADSLGGLCVAHVYAGEFDRAIALSEETFQISHSIGNVWGQSYSKWAIGEAFGERGEFNQAIKAMEECVHLGELAGFLAAQTYTRSKLAEVYADLGDLETAREVVRIVQDVVKKHDYRVDNAVTLGVLARIQVLSGDLSEAQITIDEVKKELFQGSWAIFQLPVLFAESEIALHSGNYQRAICVTEDLLTRLRQYGMHLKIPETLYLQGSALLGLGQNKDATESFQEALAAAEAIGSRRTLWRILLALSRVENDNEKTDEMLIEARHIVEFIVANIEEEHRNLREIFLKQDDVQAVIGGG